MAFTSPEDLKKRRPDLYEEIRADGRELGLAEGYKTGHAQGLEIARQETEARIAAAAAKEIERLRGIAAAKKFERQVAKLRTEEGITLGAAIVRVAKQDPKAHEDYLDRLRAGEAGPLK